MGLSSRVRKLAAARGVEARGGVVPHGLVWSSPVVRIDPESLSPGQRIVTDHCIVKHSLFFQAGDPSESRSRDRLAEPDDRQDHRMGRPRDRPRRAWKRGGALLEYEWPWDLAPSPPESAGAA